MDMADRDVDVVRDIASLGKTIPTMTQKVPKSGGEWDSVVQQNWNFAKIHNKLRDFFALNICVQWQVVGGNYF